MAGSPVRELIARVKFQLDQQSVNGANRAIENIKKKLDKLTGKIKVSLHVSSVDEAIRRMRAKFASVTCKVKVSVNSASLNSVIQQIRNKLHNINIGAHINANVTGMTVRAQIVHVHGQIHGGGGGNGGGGWLSGGGALGALGGLAAAYGGYVGVQQITDSADAMMNLDGRLRTVTTDEQERLKVESLLYDMGQRTRQSLESLGSLYFGVARAAEEMGFAQEDNLKVTETVSKALVVGGASAQEASATILQLSQALGSGRLQGDELRSLDENASALMKHVAEYFGTNVAGLKELGAQGELTSDEVMRAILSASKEIDKEFQNMPITFGQSMNVMSNSWDRFIMRVENTSGIFSTIANGIAKAFERIGTQLEEIGNSDFFAGVSEFFDSLDGQQGNLSDQIANIVEPLIKIGMVLAPILAGLMAFGGLASVFEPLAAAFSAIEGALAAIGIGLAPLIGILAGVAAAIKYVSENWDETVAMFQPGMDIMQEGIEKFQKAWEDLQPLIVAIQPLLDILIEQIGEFLVQSVANAWNIFTIAFNGMASLAETVGNIVARVKNEVDWLASALEGVISAVRDFVGLQGSISDTVSSFSAGIYNGALAGIGGTHNEQSNVFNVTNAAEMMVAQRGANDWFYD